ncbi:MAG: ribonuclease H-like domain-containing protein [Vicinamibacteria bacterium]
MSSTRERLERLFSTGKRDQSLTRLENELLGDAAPNLSLKERLERLVAVAASRPRRVPEPDRAVPVRQVQALTEALADGREIANELGSFFCVERFFPLEHRHGRVELGRLLEVPRESFSILAKGSEEAEIALERALFVDVETTGLAGGSGTYAFLIGLGFVEDGTFVLRQLFMRDYREEAAMLRALREVVSRAELLVSYNGKSFDVPLLESRFVLTRQSFSFEERLHFDLLHPARSLWKARFESCRLSELEQWLLGIERENDVPGHLIPDIYFRFVRTGDASQIPYVFEHNAQDILSLAALTVSASDMLDEENLPENPIDDFSLGRLFERVLEPERSMLHYGRAVAAGLTGSARRRSLRGLAELHKRRGERERARELWEELSREDGLESVLALHELAMHWEHRERDFASAFALCEQALERLDSGIELPLGFRERWREAFQHRRGRLSRKLVGRRLQ